MAHQVGGAAGGAEEPPRRGFHVPDVSDLVGKGKSKDRLLSYQPGSGNLNRGDNMTAEERQKMFFDYLLSNGVPREELETDFGVPQRIGDQGEDGNALNLRASGIYRVWAGSRREYYYLKLKSVKDDSPQIAGDLKSILNAIEILKEDLNGIFQQLKGIRRVAYGIPKQLRKDMVIPKPEKTSKRRK